MRLSIVIPMHNEERNAAPMLERVHEALSSYTLPWELIVVDDGSSDGTATELQKGANRFGGHVRVVRLRRNFGQSAAMQAGIDAARGEVIATLDGDLQNDPHDIPRMVERLQHEELDLVAGWRKERKDGLWLRRLPSQAANRIIAALTGVSLHDYGCSLKVYRTEVLRRVRLYGEMHRFIPAWMAKYTSPARIAEEVVTHHPRIHGKSKYGISRTFRVIIDLLSVWFFMRYAAKPGHFFGAIGMVSGAIGSAMLLYLFVHKLLGEDIGNRPMLITAVLLILMAVQFMTTGVVAELLARTYYEAGPSAGHAYLTLPDSSESEPAWHELHGQPGDASDSTENMPAHWSDGSTAAS